jgi:hypothetical protein
MNRQDIKTGYSSIKRIIDFLIDQHSITFETSENAPSKFNEMVAYCQLFGARIQLKI